MGRPRPLPPPRRRDRDADAARGRDRGRPAPDAPPFRTAAPPAVPSATPARGSTPSSGSQRTPCPAAHPRPGPRLPPRFGKPDTVSRQFRRWAKQGLWTKLLEALADEHYPGITILRRLESWICRAYRRAWRLLGVGGMALARRLGFLSALRGPSWLLPDPDLSEQVFSKLRAAMLRAREHGLRVLPPGFLRSYKKLLAIAAGRRSIPRCPGAAMNGPTRPAGGFRPARQGATTALPRAGEGRTSWKSAGNASPRPNSRRSPPATPCPCCRSAAWSSTDPHLPVWTDSHAAHALSVRAAEQAAAATDLPAVVLPPLWLGLSEHHFPFGGTISLDYATFHAVLRCIVRSLRADGFGRLFIVNGHGGNIEPLAVSARELAHEFAHPRGRHHLAERGTRRDRRHPHRPTRHPARLRRRDQPLARPRPRPGPPRPHRGHVLERSSALRPRPAPPASGASRSAPPAPASAATPAPPPPTRASASWKPSPPAWSE